MSGAGLTHSGFYNYFKSKSDLYVEALNCFFTDPGWKNCWEGVEITRIPRTLGRKSSAHIFLTSILTMSKTPARWSPCPPT
ncbi:MAG: TetR/AcrR family transcriptional regulator [Terracidiphilus sp.]